MTRLFAKLSELKAGDTIELDDGFTCAEAGEAKVVQRDGGLCFRCGEGWHYLTGQLADDDNTLIGIYKVQL